MSELLTDAEHRALTLTGDLWNLLCQEIVGYGPSREGDLRELAHDLHVIQERILAQAAGRAYPDRYRLLGGVVQVVSEGERHDAVPHSGMTGILSLGPKPPHRLEWLDPRSGEWRPT